MSIAAAISRDSTTKTAAVVLVVCLCASAWLAWRLDASRGEQPPDEVLYLQTPRAVRFMSLGYTGLAACIYWTRAVQYFGEKNVAKAKRFDLLLPLLNLTVSLDPHLDAAYTFGGIFLSQSPPFGSGTPDAAVDFVERGIKDNPNDWRLYYHLGFIHYMERHDYRAAADAFQRGAKVAGNPPWMNGMPALMLQRAGDIQTARLLWTKMYEGAENETIRKNAYTRLVALRVDDDVIHLEQIAETYRQRTGTYPQDWGQLISQGLLRGVPLDPTGTPYKLLPGGKVVVEDAMKFPFITKGIPEGQQAPNNIPIEPQKSQEKR
jgi:tetratricopeptide (TPR) repeat protein